MILLGITLKVISHSAYCGDSGGNIHLELDSFIDTVPEENINPFMNDLRRMGILHLEETPLADNGISWKAITLFVSLTILGYIIFRHGQDILDMVNSFLQESSTEIIDFTIRISREAARQQLHTLAQNPNTHSAIRYYMNMYRSSQA